MDGERQTQYVKNIREYYKHVEESIISLPDAVSSPWTMMIMDIHASIASSTM